MKTRTTGLHGSRVTAGSMAMIPVALFQLKSRQRVTGRSAQSQGMPGWRSALPGYPWTMGTMTSEDAGPPPDDMATNARVL